MQDHMSELACEIELQPGERLTLPETLITRVGPGRWRVSVQPLIAKAPARGHQAFLNSFAAEDEGLYDDLAR